MGSKKNQIALTVAFFCTVGWVYSGSAIGEEPVSGANPAAAPAPVAAAPAADTGDAAPVSVKSAATAAAPAPRKTTAAADAVTVSHFDTVSLSVQATDLASVLQLLSIQSKRNIVPSPKVTGSVTANLYDVTFREALDAILQQNGAGFIEKGNFIYVYTLAELDEIQKRDRKVSSRYFELNYITAKDAATFITPILSSAALVAQSGQVAASFQPTLSDAGGNTDAHGERILVRDYPEVLDEVAKLIKQLDTAPQQVMVEATILQADLNEDLALGVDVAVLGNIGPGALSGIGPGGLVSQLINGGITAHPVGGGATDLTSISQSSNVSLGFLTNNVAVFIKALDKVTDTTILAHPKITTLNRQRAEIHVGAKIAYLSTTNTATASTQTAEFLDTGTQLTLRPFISNDGKIRLELKPSISDAKLRNAGSDASPVTLPDQTTQELTTNVMVPDGQTVILGGLFKEQTTVTRSQVPGIGDIPIIGNAFKAHDNSVRRSEVIFLITPHIVKDTPMAEAGAAAAEGVEQVKLGARSHLLPFSRSKQTAGHVRDALQFASENNKDKALYEADMALSLDPGSLEARRLKESLTGQRVYEPGRDLLRDAVDVMIEQQTGVAPKSRVKIVPDPAPALPKASGKTSAAPSSDKATAETKPAADAQAEAVVSTEVPAIPAVDLLPAPAPAPAAAPAAAQAPEKTEPSDAAEPKTEAKPVLDAPAPAAVEPVKENSDKAVEQPKAEEPKVEEPKAEEPKAEAPAAPAPAAQDSDLQGPAEPKPEADKPAEKATDGDDAVTQNILRNLGGK